MKNQNAPTSGAPLDPTERGRTMTIQKFLKHTAAVPVPVLRHAITVALSVERPSSPEAYARFYCRVIGELDTAQGTPCDPVSNATASVAA